MCVCQHHPIRMCVCPFILMSFTYAVVALGCLMISEARCQGSQGFGCGQRGELETSCSISLLPQCMYVLIQCVFQCMYVASHHHFWLLCGLSNEKQMCVVVFLNSDLLLSLFSSITHPHTCTYRFMAKRQVILYFSSQSAWSDPCMQTKHTKTFINKLHKVQKGAFHKLSVEAFRSQRARKEQQRLSVIRAFRRKLSKTLRILFKTQEAWRARTRAFLKIFSRRKRRAVSVICPAARFGPLLAHNTTVKNPPKKLAKSSKPAVTAHYTHTHRNRSALIDRWKKRQGRKLKMQILCWRSLIQSSIHPDPEGGGGWIVLNEGEHDVMFRSSERSSARMGSETRLGKFMAGSNEEAMHTYKEAKHTVWK